MKTHSLKTHPEHFRYIHAGVKTFELRRSDRDFNVGDRLILEEYNPDTHMYTGHKERREITHILKGSAQTALWGLDKDFVILSIKEIDL